MKMSDNPSSNPSGIFSAYSPVRRASGVSNLA